MKWLIFITVMLWTYLILERLTRRRRQLLTRVSQVHAEESQTLRQSADAARVNPAKRVSRLLAERFFSNTRKEVVQKISDRLAQAGMPWRMTALEWLGLRLLLTGCGAGLGVLYVALVHADIKSLAMVLALVMAGFIGPDFWLSRKIRLRQGLVLRQLPSVLDLLTVSVEAGLGFDQALAKSAEKLSGPLADEFARGLREISLGRSRAETLQRIGQRTGVPAVQSFVSAVVQADKLGIGLAQVLRVQSEEVRRTRRMDASERAQKAPIKMLFPLVLFVFPALFIIILGPALLHMLQIFHMG